MIETDIQHLRTAIAIARRAREHGNHPFGSLLVDENNQVILEAENTVIKMQKISGPEIDYTPQAIEHEVQGTMVVKCLITIDGTVHNCRVLQGLPFMDRAAVDALQKQRYQPYLVGGQPVEVDLTFRIRLVLPQ